MLPTGPFRQVLRCDSVFRFFFLTLSNSEVQSQIKSHLLGSSDLSVPSNLRKKLNTCHTRAWPQKEVRKKRKEKEKERTNERTNERTKERKKERTKERAEMTQLDSLTWCCFNMFTRPSVRRSRASFDVLTPITVQ